MRFTNEFLQKAPCDFHHKGPFYAISYLSVDVKFNDPSCCRIDFIFVFQITGDEFNVIVTLCFQLCEHHITCRKSGMFQHNGFCTVYSNQIRCGLPVSVVLNTFCLATASAVALISYSVFYILHKYTYEVSPYSPSYPSKINSRLYYIPNSLEFFLTSLYRKFQNNSTPPLIAFPTKMSRHLLRWAQNT